MQLFLKKLPKGIIFDCDGVIIDSFDSNTHFYNTLRKAVGLPQMTQEQRMQVHQLTGAEALELVIPKNLREQAQDAYKKIDYAKDIAPLLPVNEGLHELLAYCKERGIKTAIHTNRIIAMQEILDINGLSEYFSLVMTPQQLPAKPDPIGSLTICKDWDIDTDDALFIGDSQNDLNTATAAKIPFVAFKNPKLVSDNHADNFNQIKDCLESFAS